MKKSWGLALSVGAAIALIATGCGKGNGDSSASSQSGLSGGATSKAFTITVSYWEERKAWADAVEQKFKQKYPNAVIDWKKYEGDKYVNGLLTSQLAAGQAADIIINQSPAAYGKAGYVADMTDLPFAADEFEGLKSQDSYEGKLYGVPLESVTTGVFYNKKIFADLGINTPQNWNEFIAANDKIKAAGITPILIGAKDSWTANIVGVTINHSAVYTANPGFDKAIHDGTAKFNGQELTKGMKMVEQLAANGYFNKDAFSIGYDQLRQQFADGKGAMVINGNWFLGDLTAKVQPSFEIGYFPIRDENGKATLVAGGDKKVSLNAKSEHLEQAKDLAVIMFDKSLLPLYLKTANALPTVSGVSVDYDQKSMKEIVDLLSALPSSQQIGAFWPGSTNTKFGDMIAQTLADKKWNPSDLDQLQKLYDTDKSTLVNIPQ
ncbi:ABC transporter substrate-binding protein [Cohnella sp. 56]|uniref:ABC transporter substrate-binding protein n=1 Tax=Cohnella sp. 56 TaxID=3113722 RepID=UPI0030EAB176